MPVVDAVVVGSGPNGLAAAIALARAGWSVRVLEEQPTAGGGARTAERTLPGHLHDLCSAVHPLAVGSPFLRTLPLERHGLEWVVPDAPLAHAFEDGPAVLLERSVAATAAALGEDGPEWERLVGGVAADWPALEDHLLGPPLRVPRHPRTSLRFAARGVRPATAFFRTPRARALFAGLAAHAMLPLDRAGTAAFGLVLGALGHVNGWPFPRGGAGRIAAALLAHLAELGGRVETDRPVRSLGELPRARAVLLDLAVPRVLALAGDLFPARHARRLRGFRPGPGVFKVDWALDGPVPWADPAAARAGTVHVGGPAEEVGAALAAVDRGLAPGVPFVLAAQPSLFDPTRAPAGAHVLWAYAHVPRGFPGDLAGALEDRIERCAPGFRDRIRGRAVTGPADLERENANHAGGEIAGGANTLRQVLARPVLSTAPYRTPVPGLYLCSSATPPGGGVHGMCGWHAARAVLRDLG